MGMTKRTLSFTPATSIWGITYDQTCMRSANFAFSCFSKMNLSMCPSFSIWNSERGPMLELLNLFKNKQAQNSTHCKSKIGS